MLAKEQKQNELALAVFGLANDRNYSDQRIGILEQLCSRPGLRKKKNFFFELELNHFLKVLHNVLPVLVVNMPVCSECLYCLEVLNGVAESLSFRGIE